MPDGNNRVPFYKQWALYAAVGIGVVTTAALVVDFKAQTALERVSLRGTVAEESYIGGHYAFSMQTDYGAKAFLVSRDGKGPELSSIDALIQPGTKVTIEGIVKQDIPGKLEFRVMTNQIKPE